MVEIDDKKYSLEYIKKAIKLYEALTSGELEETIARRIHNEF